MAKNIFRPRNMLSKEVAGICGVARLTDKARAAHAGEIGEYKYGADSEQDKRILSFLGISAEAFQDAMRIDNDVRLGTWVLDNCRRSSKEISEFNRKLKSWWQSRMPENDFAKRLRKLAEKDEDRFLFWFFPSAWLWKRFFR
ncbi:MAG: DUF5069 domain-containing protein [Candidatus Poribacteria bacterium]|nr:DUF5069 domain-containing protein [Candidatus Poribacteria bacterium]